MTFHGLSRTRPAGLALTLALALLAPPAWGQDTTTEEEDGGDRTIIVTATKIRQGGAQDIAHFRSVSLNGDFLPATNDLTIEGLMGEHDLTLPEGRPCRQTFCLTGAAMPAALPLRPDDQWFVGLGFSSNVDANKLQREPLSLVMVVDRSGSMSGWPMQQVKYALHSVTGKLRKGDRIGIIIYGDEPLTHLPMTEWSGNEDSINAAIDSIAIEGSTALEDGLRAGYTMASEELRRSHGKTRVMLFTDENPNVGDTSAEGFMAQAEAGSRSGVGLTTFGVGVHFDAELATHVSSVRGGNLFFIDNEGSAKQVFDREFFNMVNEVAHDIDLAFVPPPGFRITGVFGVPDELMTSAPEGAIKVHISTAFLSSNGGGIYLTLAKDSAHADLPAASLPQGAPLLTGTLRYADARTGKVDQDKIVVLRPGNEPAPVALGKAQLLVDEFVTMRSALAVYHDKNDKKGAFHQLDGLSKRLALSGIPGMNGERKLVDGLRDRAAYVAGYAGEMPRALRPLALKGEWKVLSRSGLTDIARGDRVEITEDGEFITTRVRGEDVSQTIQVNDRQLRLIDADLVFNYRIKGNRLAMVSEDGMSELVLQRDQID